MTSQQTERRHRYGNPLCSIKLAVKEVFKNVSTLLTKYMYFCFGKYVFH